MLNKNTRLLAVLLTAFFLCGLYGSAGAARTVVTYLTKDQVQVIVDARINELVPPMIAEAIKSAPIPEPEPEPIIEPEPTPEPAPEPAPTPVYDANVKDYGAKGDGVSDDTLSINKAITAVPSGIVFIPNGTYKISSSINLKSNITLQMESGTILKTSNTGAINLINIGEGISNAAVTGGVLEGPNAGMAENYNQGILLWRNCQNITVKNVEIRYFMCDGIYIGAWTDTELCPNGLLIEGCYIHHCGRNGISIISHRNATYRDNEISFIGLTNTATSTGAGIKFEVNSSGGKNWVGENILVEGNNIHDCHIFGLMVSDYWDRSNPYHPVSITVQNNTVHDNATLGKGSYTINANNCLEFTTYTASRWVKWDGISYSSGLKTW